MAIYNPDFWEVQVGQDVMERIPESAGLWREDEESREFRLARKELFETLLPLVQSGIEVVLTRRQREAIKLYFFCNKTQVEIAAIMAVNQSTVSRHLYGTIRDGKKIGGALSKLQKYFIDQNHTDVQEAFRQFKAASNLH